MEPALQVGFGFADLTLVHLGGVRCPRTFSNYLGYARVGCLLVGAPDAVFGDAALKRAKVAIGKRSAFVPRKKRFVQLAMLQQLVPLVIMEPHWKVTVLWVLTAYAFLLRWGAVPTH